jgi:hypothetical protein
VAEILENVTIILLGIVDCCLSEHSEKADNVLRGENLLSPTAAMLTRGLASIHLVKYLTVTTLYLQFPCVFVSGPTMSTPHLCSAHEGVMRWDGALKFGKNFWHVLMSFDASSMIEGQ